MTDPGSDYLAALDAVREAVLRGAHAASQGRRDHLSSIIDELTDRLTVAAKRPDEPAESTVLFTKWFPDGPSQGYAYVAHRDRRGVWNLSGTQHLSFTWDKLLEWLDDKNRSILTLRVAQALSPTNENT